MSDYQWVLPRISVGAALTAVDVPQLVKDEIGYIVDATRHDDSTFSAGNFQLGIYDESKLDVLFLNIDDDGQSKRDMFTHIVAPWFTARWFQKPAERWNFHCDAGINRGPSTCFFCLLLLGFSASDAEDAIRHVRPQVGLAYKADAMAAARELGYLVS